MIKIVTDSTSYMTREYAQENDITIVQLSLEYGGKSIEEGMPGSFEEVFADIDVSGDNAKSSQPSPERFKDAFDKVLSEGNEVFCITISSSLSGTYNSARLGAEMTGSDKITLFDSQGAAQLTLLHIEEAVRLIKEGKTRAEIAEALNARLQISSEIFVPVTLKYLIRGGRIGGVSATIGSLLHVKPLLAFTNGVLACKRKVMGMQKAIRELVAEIPKTAREIYVMQIAKSAFFTSLLEKVKEKFPQLAIKQGEVGPVVGMHVGPGTIGIAYC